MIIHFFILVLIKPFGQAFFTAIQGLLDETTEERVTHFFNELFELAFLAINDIEHRQDGQERADIFGNTSKLHTLINDTDDFTEFRIVGWVDALAESGLQNDVHGEELQRLDETDTAISEWSTCQVLDKEIGFTANEITELVNVLGSKNIKSWWWSWIQAKNEDVVMWHKINSLTCSSGFLPTLARIRESNTATIDRIVIWMNEYLQW